MAEELLDLQASFHPLPINRQVSMLDRGMLFALNYLMVHPEKSYPKDLSREMAVSSARIAALLNHLEALGLVTRTPDLEDNRQVIVTLTAKGQQFIRQKKEQTAALLASVLEHLGPEDAEAYLRISRRLISIMAERGELYRPGT